MGLFPTPNIGLPPIPDVDWKAGRPPSISWPDRKPKPKPKPTGRVPFPPGFTPPKPVNNPKPPADVKKTQKFLQNQGYDIKADGNLGPLTNAALKDWHSGVKKRNPAQWNISNARAAATPGTPGSTGAGADAGAGSGAGAGAGAGARSGNTGKGDKGTKPDANQKALLALIKQARNAIVDPQELASQMSEYEYNPAIAEITRQIGQQGAQNEQNIKDIGTWYDQVGVTNAAGAQSNRDMLATSLAEQDAGVEGFLGAIGGASNPGAASVAGSAALARGGLASQGAAQGRFDNDLAGITGLQRAQSLVDTRNRGANALGDLSSALATAQAQKGKSQAETLASAGATRFSQLAQLQNMMLAQQLADEAEAKAGADVRNTDADTNLTGLQAEGQAVLNATQRAQLALFKQDPYGTGEEISDFEELNPSSRIQLAGALKENLFGPGGHPTVYPGRIRELLKKRLFGIAGFSPSDPKALSWINSLLPQSEINWWNQRYPNKRYNG